jgi:hypothetical protein
VEGTKGGIGLLASSGATSNFLSFFNFGMSLMGRAIIVLLTIFNFFPSSFDPGIVALLLHPTARRICLWGPISQWKICSKL